jgi:alkyl hydroperoxide reductase subunit F
MGGWVMQNKSEWELIIIGAGPAGMTAAIYAGRKQLDTLVITKDVGGQALWSYKIENYPCFTFITGAQLVERFQEHLQNFGVRIEYTSVVRLSREAETFAVDTEDSRRFFAHSVIISSGKSPRQLNVPGEMEFLGKGVAYCATCDAPLFAGKNVAVIGGGNSGLDAAAQLIKICPKVYIIEIQDDLQADKVIQDNVSRADSVEVLTSTEVKEIRGDNFVRSIVVRNVQSGKVDELQVEGVFIEIGLVPNSDFVRDLLPLNERGEIPVDCSTCTGIPGLYAAGDVTDVPHKQIICAAGDGAKAALSAYSYLVRRPSPSPNDK